MPPARTVSPDGDAIREIRERLGLSCQQLARKIGRHPQSVRNLEIGARSASAVFINQLAGALGVDVAEITKQTTSERAS